MFNYYIKMNYFLFIILNFTLSLCLEIPKELFERIRSFHIYLIDIFDIK